MIEYHVKIFDSLPSTNSYALEHASTLSHGDVIHAVEQTAGRGRYNRLWENAGGNLTFSIVLNIADIEKHVSQLSSLTALAVVKALIKVGVQENDIHIKWPNDVLVQNKKVCGILLERSEGKLVIGIGINKNWAPDDKVCLKDLGIDVTLDDMRDTVLENFNKAYDDWIKSGFDQARAEILNRSWKLGEEIGVRLRNASYTGIYKDLDKTGALILETVEGETLKITSAEVFEI